MACCAFLLSEKGRQCLGAKLLLVNMAIAIMGLILIGAGAILRFLFYQQRDLVKGYNYKLITNIIMSVGGGMVIFHLLGAKVCFDCGSFKTRYTFRGILLVHFVLSFVVLGTMGGVSYICQHTVRSATKGFVAGFRNVMGNYSDDAVKRLEIDMIQMKHRCCGGMNHSDWLAVEWYDDKFLRPEVLSRLKISQKEMTRRMKGKISARGVPFTCCDPHKMGPCIHDSILFQKPGFQKDVGGKRFYQKGCGEALMNNIKWLLNAITFWVLIPFWTEVLSIVYVKYLYTSICNADECGDEKGPGYGYFMEECPIELCDCFDCDINQFKEKTKEEEEDEWTAASNQLRELQLEKFRQMKKERKKEKKMQDMKQNAGWSFQEKKAKKPGGKNITKSKDGNKKSTKSKAGNKKSTKSKDGNKPKKKK